MTLGGPWEMDFNQFRTGQSCKVRKSRHIVFFWDQFS